MSLLQEDSMHVNSSYLEKKSWGWGWVVSQTVGRIGEQAAALFSTAVPKGGCSALVKSQSCRLQAWQRTPGMWMVTLYFTSLDFFFWLLVRQFWSRWALTECTDLLSGVGREFQSSSAVFRAWKGQTQQLPRTDFYTIFLCRKLIKLNWSKKISVLNDFCCREGVF